MEKIYENYYRLLLLTKGGSKTFTNETSKRMERFFSECLQKEGYNIESIRVGKNYAFLKFSGGKRPDIIRIKSSSENFCSERDLWDKRYKLQESIRIYGKLIYAKKSKKIKSKK